MPIHIIAEGFANGPGAIPYAIPALKTLPWLLLIGALKFWFGGTKNRSERLMHSKIVMVTGGTSGIGAAVTRDLAQRGAQIILLTRHAPSDPFLVEFIEDMRNSTNNQLIYAEQVDLSSLHSIRVFATKWVDNAPPRRLDMIILCANTFTPRFGLQARTHDGLDGMWGLNYLANFHLLSILSPAVRAQPPDRDVRIIFATCASYIGGDVAKLQDSRDPLPIGKEYGTSKLALMVFAQAFQKHLDAYQRPDKHPSNARVVIVDPGLARTPGMRRWLSLGSLWGLVIYLCMWPFWWLVLKSPDQGSQSFLMAAMDADLGQGVGGKFIKECRERDFMRKEVRDEKVAKKLWEFSEKQVVAVEKEGAVRRALAKKEAENSTKPAHSKGKNGVAVESSVTGAMTGKPPASRRSRRGSLIGHNPEY